LFGFFAVFDDLAKMAGMFAIEGFFDSDRQRRAFRVIDHHADPRDGLEERPVSANGKNQQENNYKLGGAISHCLNI
jgi:hypothetical protein